MPSPPDNADPISWHRHFAMHANNRAWALSVETLDLAGRAEMLDAAHAAAWHWSRVGTELNRMRAIMLLAEAHAVLGHGDLALAYAEEMRGYFLGKDDTPDWETAFAHAIYAHAAHAAGEIASYRAAYEDATAAIGAIAKEQDRAIVLKTFDLIPAP
jgi:hypothetical protein